MVQGRRGDRGTVLVGPRPGSRRAAPGCEHVFVSGEATILHADLDAFYASVEQRDDPRLRGRPVIVGGGVVLAASYEAKACGVRTAMGGRQARRLCPDAVVVPPRMSAYSEASKAVFAVFHDTTPLVEGLSIDEAFLDVRGLGRIAGHAGGDRRAAAPRGARPGRLPITVGVARTKFLAKVASGVAKPDGLLVVPPDGELAFLHPLPVERLWGVGPVTAAQAPRPRHQHRRPGRAAGGGGAGVDARAGVGPPPARARAQPRPAPGQVGRRRRSIGVAARARAAAPHRRGDRRRRSSASSTGVTRRCARRSRVGRTVVLRLRFDDFSRATRSHTLPQATAQTASILARPRASCWRPRGR